jgi:hypothetical protein
MFTPACFTVVEAVAVLLLSAGRGVLGEENATAPTV